MSAFEVGLQVLISFFRIRKQISARFRVLSAPMLRGYRLRPVSVSTRFSIHGHMNILPIAILNTTGKIMLFESL